jgi:DNA repair exonuclease SbcCD ATPase subunit
MMQKTTELVKNILKYADELHKKHKTVKEEESSTQDAVHQMKESTVAVQKAKDLYNSRLAELEKLRRDNASAKDIEKAEAKLKKHQDEYKNLAEKHNPIKQEFEQRMAATCKVSKMNYFYRIHFHYLFQLSISSVFFAAFSRCRGSPLETNERVHHAVH